MKRILLALLLVLSVLAVPLSSLARTEEPVIYTIKKGDTLWGLSERFINDPYYWPDLWARNPKITNPHLIYPGQRVRIYPDRIEIEPAPVTETAAATPAPAETAPETSFTVTGGEGFLLEKKAAPVGYVVATHNDRHLLGEGDFVYTDIGSADGARPGDRFSIFKEMETVSHPVTNMVLGYRIASLGTLQLDELEQSNSRAVITHSFQEIGPGSYLLPYRDRKRDISLKAAVKDLAGYIVAARDGNISVGTGDIVYLDLGRKQGLQVGNLMYVVREVQPERLYTDRKIGYLPMDVIGAVVVVEAGENTAAALIVKSVRAIYKGDRVEFNIN